MPFSASFAHVLCIVHINKKKPNPDSSLTACNHLNLLVIYSIISLTIFLRHSGFFCIFCLTLKYSISQQLDRKGWGYKSCLSPQLGTGSMCGKDFSLNKQRHLWVALLMVYFPFVCFSKLGFAVKLMLGAAKQMLVPKFITFCSPALCVCSKFLFPGGRASA